MRKMLREDTRGWGVVIFFYHYDPPLLSRSQPYAQAKRGEISSGVRRTAMVHFIAYLKGIHNEEEIAVSMMTTSLEDTMAHFLPRRKYYTQYGRTWCILR